MSKSKKVKTLLFNTLELIIIRNPPVNALDKTSKPVVKKLTTVRRMYFPEMRQRNERGRQTNQTQRSSESENLRSSEGGIRITATCDAFGRKKMRIFERNFRLQEPTERSRGLETS